MAKYLAQAQTLRQRVHGLSQRIDKVVEQAGSSEWPHAGIRNTVRLYVKTVAESTRQTLLTIADELKIQWRFIDQPLTQINDQRLQRHFRDTALAKNLKDEEVAEAVFAVCETQMKLAAYLVTHLEACISGDQTIQGRVIARGRLWDK